MTPKTMKVKRTPEISQDMILKILRAWNEELSLLRASEQKWDNRCRRKDSQPGDWVMWKETNERLRVLERCKKEITKAIYTGAVKPI